MMNDTFKKFLLLCVTVPLITASAALAQTQTRGLSSPLPPETNPNSSTFRIIVCDGPTLPNQDMVNVEEAKLGHKYVPCDFNGLMYQAQHLIDIMMVLGVILAIVLFTYMGFLYITGTPENIKKARAIFPKVFWGFIIMLSAWFIIYQILTWFTGNNAFKTLLGSP